MLVQLVPGKMHGSPVHVVHCADVKLAQCAATSVLWHETPIGLFDVSEKLDKSPTDDGVTISALYSCRVDGPARDAFSHHRRIPVVLDEGSSRRNLVSASAITSK